VQLEDIDLYDPDGYVAAVPHEMFATLRREAPVHWHEKPTGDGFWCITRHADVGAVNRDAALFSSWEQTALMEVPPPEGLEMSRLMMLNMDPPQHTQLRKIVNRGFTPKRIRDLMDVLEQRAANIVDEIIDKGSCDFVSEVAAELPLQAIAEFLGVPQEDRRMIFDWSNQMIGFDDPEFRTSEEQAQAAAAQLYAYAEGLAAERQANPRDDIVTALISAEVDGEALTTNEFDLFFLLLAVAGNETTRNAISHGMLALIEHPEQRQRLLDDPTLMDTAVEEILRWATPVMHFRRTATRDTVIHGQEIKAGDGVIMWHMSANRDEDVFDDPYTFDVGREHNPHTMHVAFGGGGPHFCLGANLARAEIKVMFEALLPRIPDMELAGPVRRLRSNFINGIKEMPVSFSPSSPTR
jgi:cholest-4-en-3-one 26-monooxygenase